MNSKLHLKAKTIGKNMVFHAKLLSEQNRTEQKLYFISGQLTCEARTITVVKTLQNTISHK